MEFSIRGGDVEAGWKVHHDGVDLLGLEGGDHVHLVVVDGDVLAGATRSSSADRLVVPTCAPNDA